MTKVQFRVDSAETLTAIDAAATAAGKNRSEFCRDLVLAAISSGGEGGVPGTVGTDSGSVPHDGAGTLSGAAPSPPKPASSPPQAPPPASAPSPVAPAAVPPVGDCPDCGAPAGQHQGYCIRVTGVSPVKTIERTTELEQKPEEPAMSPLEAREDFIGRRHQELLADGHATTVAAAIAEGEWRQLTNAEPAPAAAPSPSPAAPPAPTFSQEACGACGCMKLPTEQCRDCGSRPTVVL